MRAELERRPLIFLFAALVIGITANVQIWNLVFFPIFFFIASTLSRRVWVTVGLLLGLAVMPDLGQLKNAGFVQADSLVTSRPKVTEFRWTVLGNVGGVPLLLVGSGSPPSEGQLLEIAGTVTPSVNPDELAGILVVDRFRILKDPPFMFQWAEHWRDSVKVFVQGCNLSREDQDLLLGICFSSDELSQSELQDALKGGWLRIMSASGIQAMGLAWILEAVFRFVPVPRLATVGLLTLTLILYALATGHHASTERAIFVIILSRWAFVFRREPDVLSALALTGTLILFLDPWQVYSLGFHLTLLTVAAFSLFTKRISAREKGIGARIGLGAEALWRGIAIGSFAGVPLVAQRIHQFSLAGLPAVALLITVVPVVVAMAFGSHAIWLAIPSAGIGLLGTLVEPLIAGRRMVLEIQGGLSYSVAVPSFSGYLLVLYYGAWLLTWGKRARPA